MKIVNCQQLSMEWFQAHVGNCSGSHASEIINYLKNGQEGAKRKDYRIQKVCEILTGYGLQDNFVTKEMEWGLENEPNARAAYEKEEGVIVDQIGYAIADIPRCICSPDGLVGSEGIVGFKCPKTSTHIKWMLGSIIPEEHMPQCIFELMVLKDRKWFDFVSFDPRLPKRYRSFTIRLSRNETDIENMRQEVIKFNAEVDEVINKLKSITPEIEDDEIIRDDTINSLNGYLTEEDFEGLI